MAFIEVVGSADNVAPVQIGATCVNVGFSLGITVIVIVAVFVHCAVAGVNV
jgi:hypothetical protein